MVSLHIDDKVMINKFLMLNLSHLTNFVLIKNKNNPKYSFIPYVSVFEYISMYDFNRVCVVGVINKGTSFLKNECQKNQKVLNVERQS